MCQRRKSVESEDDKMTRLCDAASHLMRLRIIKLLFEHGELSSTECEKLLGISVGLFYYHLDILRQRKVLEDGLPLRLREESREFYGRILRPDSEELQKEGGIRARVKDIAVYALRKIKLERVRKG